jgi:hypothetical protein
VTAAACGGDASGFGPGVGDDPGTGTNTLSIEGNATAEPSVSNATDPNSFTTEVEIRISLNGTDVTQGTVEVESVEGVFALAYDTSQNRWRGVQNGYFEVYQLDITSGADNIEGVRIDGPDIHSFTAPMQGATVDSTLPLDVTWTRDEKADAARFSTREFDVDIADTESYTLAATTLRSEQDKAEEEEIELVRSNLITPAGAAAGSSFRVSVRNHIDLVVQPNP